jgi:hypothetical protein
MSSYIIYATSAVEQYIVVLELFGAVLGISWNIPAYLGYYIDGTYDFTCICNILFMFGTPPRGCTTLKTLKCPPKP